MRGAGAFVGELLRLIVLYSLPSSLSVVHPLLCLPRPAFKNKGFPRVAPSQGVKLFYSSPPFPFSQSPPGEVFFNYKLETRQ